MLSLCLLNCPVNMVKTQILGCFQQLLRYLLKEKRLLFIATTSGLLSTGIIFLVVYYFGAKSDRLEEIETNSNMDFLWKQSNLLNITNFEWILKNKEICKTSKLSFSTEMLTNRGLMPILVSSARSHFKEREAIRMTWGSISHYKTWDIRLIFLLGEGKASAKQLSEENRKLLQENEKFGDLVIGGFVDSYKNMTLKHLMGYKWILNYCRKAKIITKVDDDVFLDIFQWLDMISAATFEFKFKTRSSASSKGLPQMFCKFYQRRKPSRGISNKWYTSYITWPEEFYPPFCGGRAYAIDMDLVEKIYSVSNSIGWYWIDDVFVTGQLVQEVQKKFKEDNIIWRVDTTRISTSKSYRSACQEMHEKFERRFKTVTLVGRNNFKEEMLCFWNRTLNDHFISHVR